MATDIEQPLQPASLSPGKSAPRFVVSATSRSSDVQPQAQQTQTSSQCSSTLPVIDLGAFLSETSGVSETASTSRQIADCLQQTGCLVVRDPRVAVGDSDRFLDLMERYFCQTHSSKLSDARPQLHYQVGSTPEGVEVPKSARDPAIKSSIAAQPEENRATLPQGPDVKWRFMWRIGPRPHSTQYAELNSPAIIPAGFNDWETVMNAWGDKMLATCQAVAELAAVGFGLPSDAFTQRMHLGPHLLAPTGCNLAEHGKLGTCIAGYHYDLNFLTVHGKSRFPGLFIWLRSGQKVAVSIPDGCLLLQAGKQLEWLTAGHVQAGMHEVICTKATQQAIERASAAGAPLWRVSSTVFSHIASDQLLTPLGAFADQSRAAAFPGKLAGEQVQEELDAIRLSKPSQSPDRAAADQQDMATQQRL